MNAVETIAAAIAKLEAAKATEDGDERAWRYEAPNPFGVVSPPASLFDANDYLIARSMTVADAQTAVMLHRTIDPQLVILREAQAAHRSFVSGALIRTERAAVELARAILGEE